MMTPQAVFRADASAAVGTGHVVRCRTLADALMARGWTATLASRELPAGLAKSIAATDLQILDLGPDPAPLAEADTIGAATDGRITLLVADHYGIGADWLEAARDRVDVLMAIDDLADRRQPVDLLLNQNLGADVARYAELVPPAARVLTGPRYALIRPEFAQARARGRIRRGHVDRILVFMSGSDPTDVTVRVVAALAGIDVAIDVVTGAAYPHLENLRATVAQHPAITLHHDVDTVAELMDRADLSVGAPSSASWERCVLGLPTVLIALADNQLSVERRLVDLGAAVTAGWHATVTAKSIRDIVTKLRADPTRVAAMSRAAAAVTDGGGTARVVEEIERSAAARTERT